MVVDHEMKNLPGRPKEGIRAVKTAMLAVSTAPEDKQVVRIAFNKPQLTIASLKEEALNVMSFNQYDEVLDRRLLMNCCRCRQTCCSTNCCGSV